MLKTIIKIKIKYKYSNKKINLSRITNLISLIWVRKIDQIKNISIIICWATLITIIDEKKPINA
jgi:hypothetical protein